MFTAGRALGTGAQLLRPASCRPHTHTHARRYTHSHPASASTPASPSPSPEPHMFSHVDIPVSQTCQPTVSLSRRPNHPRRHTFPQGPFQVGAAQPSPAAAEPAHLPIHGVGNASTDAGRSPVPSTGLIRSANSVPTLGEFCWVRQSLALQRQVGRSPAGLPPAA